MKKVNGLLLSLLCISSISGLTSCTTAEDIVSEVKASLVFPNLTSGIKKGFDVYNEIDNVEISYESANPELLYFNEENKFLKDKLRAVFNIQNKNKNK